MRAVSLWNSLPADLAEANSISAFKSGLHAHLGELLFSFVE